MTGWAVSTTNHHGPGSGWSAEGGALVGRQTAGEQGGILMTEKVYKDVEVVFEVKIDWGCDSGFFFRTTAGDRAYQVNVDHLAESGVGTIWGEGFAQELRAIPYFLTEMGNAAIAAPDQTPIFDLAQWPTIWKPTEFNEIRARVEGNPPRLQVWISDLKVMDFTDAAARTEIDAQGPLAIQVHSGSRWIPDGTVAYRNIRVRDLTLPCDEPEPGMGGSAGMAGGGAAAAGSAGAVNVGGAQAGGAAGMGAGTGGSSAGTSVVLPSAGQGGTGGVTPNAPTEESGCACRAAGGGSGWGGWSVALLGLGLAGWARRRRR